MYERRECLPRSGHLPAGQELRWAAMQPALKDASLRAVEANMQEQPWPGTEVSVEKAAYR